MHAASAVLAACGGFLLAVLWMDLMFDVQVLRHRDRHSDLPEAVLASIAAYYRRVTTDASPMGHLVAAVMLSAVIVLIAQIAQIVAGGGTAWVEAASLPLCCGPVALALLRVVPGAVRLGTRTGTAPEQSALARAICRDHLWCFAGMLGFVVVQVIGAALVAP